MPLPIPRRRQSKNTQVARNLNLRNTAFNSRKKMASYCPRCQKSFAFVSARQQHIRDSLNHHVCHICPSPPDYATEDELDEHLQDEHNICVTCDKQFNTPRQLVQHDVAKHNMCMTCRKYYTSPANRNSVSIFLASFSNVGKVSEETDIAHDNPR